MEESNLTEKSKCTTGMSFNSSVVIFDSFADAPENQSFMEKSVVTHKLVHDLGKSYRTPRLTPLLLSNLEDISSREQNNVDRDASTPLNTSGVPTKFEDYNLAQQFHMTMDLCEKDGKGTQYF